MENSTPPSTGRATVTSKTNTKKAQNKPVIYMDAEAYLPLLEDRNIPEDQKIEMLQALYAIVMSFIDLGFAVKHPPSENSDRSPCGQVPAFDAETTQSTQCALQSQAQQLVQRFAVETAESADKEEGVGS